MERLLNVDQTVLGLVQQYPEAVEILKDLGFENITNPAMLNTVGRVITLRKGAAMKGIALDKIIRTFRDMGFTVREEYSV